MKIAKTGTFFLLKGTRFLFRTVYYKNWHLEIKGRKKENNAIPHHESKAKVRSKLLKLE